MKMSPQCTDPLETFVHFSTQANMICVIIWAEMLEQSEKNKPPVQFYEYKTMVELPLWKFPLSVQRWVFALIRHTARAVDFVSRSRDNGAGGWARDATWVKQSALKGGWTHSKIICRLSVPIIWIPSGNQIQYSAPHVRWARLWFLSSREKLVGKEQRTPIFSCSTNAEKIPALSGAATPVRTRQT